MRPPNVPPPPGPPSAADGSGVLRPLLYHRLRLKFGKVKVSNQGLRMESGLREFNGRTSRYIDKSKGHHWGEAYRVNCPYCREHRHRLYIGHEWGRFDERTGSHNLWLMHCMNENCVTTYTHQKAFYDDLWDDTNPDDYRDVLVQGEKPMTEPGSVEWPGRVVTLDQLEPSHPAHVYLRGRKYNPEWLGRYMGVAYCVEAHARCWYARDRIIIPVYRLGELVGWQARYVGDPPNKDVPKYMFSTGFPRSQVLYNFDCASQQPFAVVLEGATKVWRFGPEAVATFGKAVTAYQAGVMVGAWKKIAVVLDANAMEESEELFELLKTFDKEVAVVKLGEGPEPDEMETFDLRRLVIETAREQGVDLLKGE